MNDSQPDLRLRPRLVAEEEALDRRLRDAQLALEQRAMGLTPGPRRGLMLELAGELLRARGRLERLSAAA